VPKGMWVRDIDPVVALQSMTYYLKAYEVPRSGRRGASVEEAAG